MTSPRSIPKANWPWPPPGHATSVAVVLPWSREGAVFVVRWKRVSFGQQQDKFPELRHIFAPPLGQLDVTTELAAAN